eukprot:6293415-Pyramimonas_sp.AAC.1
MHDWIAHGLEHRPHVKILPYEAHRYMFNAKIFFQRWSLHLADLHVTSGARCTAAKYATVAPTIH